MWDRDFLNKWDMGTPYRGTPVLFLAPAMTAAAIAVALTMTAAVASRAIR